MTAATAIPYGPNGTFDYSALGNHADVARDAAAKIREIFRGSVVEIGRELIAVKERIDHGDFLAWVSAECGLHIRIAQRAMKAAQFVIDHAAENDNLSLLPTDTLLALAVAPKVVVTHALSDMAAGTRRTAGSIRSEATRDTAVDMAEPALVDPVDKVMASIAALIAPLAAEHRAEVYRRLEKLKEEEAGTVRPEATKEEEPKKDTPLASEPPSSPVAEAADSASPPLQLPAFSEPVRAELSSVTNLPPPVMPNPPQSELRPRFDAVPATEQKTARDFLLRGYVVGDPEPVGSDKLAAFVQSIKYPTSGEAVKALRSELLDWNAPARTSPAAVRA
jgi:hypothetical protein